MDGRAGTKRDSNAYQQSQQGVQDYDWVGGTKTINANKMNSGKSKSRELPGGRRRVVSGKPLAPRSLRRKGKRRLVECTDKELSKAGVPRQ